MGPNTLAAAEPDKEPPVTTSLVDEPAPPLSFPLERERSIPVRPGDLTRMVLAEPGLSPVEKSQFGRFGKLLGAVFHHEFDDWQNELKELYAPLDPDSDCVDVAEHSREFTEGADEAFLGAFETALIRANYRQLNRELLEYAIAEPNEQGLNYVPNFSMFEHLRVYVRGKTLISRTRRNPKNLFRKTTLNHAGYQRLVVILKFRSGFKLGPYVSSDVLYLRMFKDVPHVDLEMHLPEQGTKVRMRLIDKAQIASPFAVGLPTLAMKLLSVSLLSLLSPAVMAGILIAPISAGLNSFFGFQRAKQKHLHAMIRHLYYLSLASNASVISTLIASAEEEEYKEALLAYYFLWAHRDDPEPWDKERIDAHIESFLKEKTGVSIDFEVDDALRKLTRLGIVQSTSQGYLHAIPIEVALTILDEQWDNYFRYSNPVTLPDSDPVDGQ
jgi:hypothetical protein